MMRPHIFVIATFVLLCSLLSCGVAAHPAWGIVIDRNNQIYFSDIETIWKIDAQGKLTVFRTGVSGRHVHEINVDESGNIYGAENSYEPATQRSFSALWKMTPAGEFSYLVSPTSTPPKGLTIWKDRADNSYYVGQSESAKQDLFVLKRTPDGKVTTVAGNKKAGDAYRQIVTFNLGGTAFGADGAIYFTDNSNLRKVMPDGAMTILAGNVRVENPKNGAMPESKLSRLFGVAVDAEGNAFAADYGNRRVLKVTSGGVVSMAVQTETPWSPTGVVWKDGNLYILEFGFTLPSTYTPRVRRVAPDGRITILATVGGNGTSSGGEAAAEKSSGTTPAHGYRLLLVSLFAGLGALALIVSIWGARKRLGHRH